MPNVPVVNSYPAVEFQPSETSSVFHTDQEVTDTSGNSHMFRTYNAQYNPLNVPPWGLFNNSLPAYATVQNPDGSIHYYTNPSGATSWTTWAGSDNNTVYNAVDFGMTVGGIASANTTALSSLFTVMNAPTVGNQGGYAWIPQLQFPVNAIPSGTGVPAGIAVPPGVIMQALGTGGYDSGEQYYHFLISDGSTTVPSTLFYLSASHTSGGTYFRNIAFQWVNAQYALDTVLYLNYFNAGADGCTFNGCTTAVNIQGLAVGLRNCTINYQPSNIPVPPNFTAILLAGINCEISGPSEFNGANLNGTTTACISIGGSSPEACNLNTIRELHITGWNYGIDYSDINGTGIGSQTVENSIESCHIECINSCVNLQPSSSAGSIFDQTFSNNTINKSQDSTNGAPIVFIDSKGGAASNIGPVTLVNNMIFSNVTDDIHHSGMAQLNQYGVQIGTCESVSIIGGQISQVGTKSGSDGTANVCISGNAQLVTIDSVNLAPTYAGANFGNSTGTTGSAASEYGVLISGSPGIVQISNCYMAGLLGGAVSITGSAATVSISNCDVSAGGGILVTGTVTRLYVTNCVGYNDQSTTINTIANITIGVAYSAATQGAHSGTSYYGPSFVMFKANASGGTFQYNSGVAQTLLAGQVVCLTLASPYDAIQFNTHAPAAFIWIGN